MSALLGLRFALGTRDGRIRTALVALAAGFAVALLLLGASVPAALAARGVRGAERQALLHDPAAAGSTLWSDVALLPASGPVTGALVRPRGTPTPLPPGVTALPPAGSMLVSPALRRALERGDDPVLAARLPYRIAGQLGDADLLGPGELRFLAVEPRLTRTDAAGLTGFGIAPPTQPLDPVLALLVVVGVVVLLLPIGVVVVLAARFGAERRDRRLAALRLAGVGRRAVSAVLAVEALVAAVAGVVVGVALFVTLRQALRVLEIASLSVFPADAVPPAPLAALVLLVVPAAVVVAALAGLRGVAVEPLGVVRRGVRRPRRLLWRLGPLAAGVALLVAGAGTFTARASGQTAAVGAGVALLLLGALALLPWIVERLAGVIPGGAVPWRFARGRLVREGGTTVRVVGAVAAVLSGAIALQMLFAGLAAGYARGGPIEVPSVYLSAVAQQDALRTVSMLRAPEATVRVDLPVRGHDDRFVTLLVGDCTALAAVAAVGRCADGDVFLTAGDTFARTGAPLDLGRTVWRVPAGVSRVGPGMDPTCESYTGALLVTPAAIRLSGTTTVAVTAPGAPAALPSLLRRALAIDPLAEVSLPGADPTSHRFDAVRRGLGIGLMLVLLLVGGVLLVAVIDQLRERRAALAALAALGMRRRAMAGSILLESAVPVLAGAVVATAAGLVLGAVLLRVVSREPVVDPLVALDVLLACAVPMLVTTAGLPFAVRLMRPEGLRAE